MGHFEAGEAINTVPSHGYLEGTIRTYDTEDLAIVKHQMHKIAESVQLLFNVECEVKFEEGYPPTMNHPQLRQAVENAIEGANLEVVEKSSPSCSVKILVLWSTTCPFIFCICWYSKQGKRFCDWSSYCTS